MARAPLNPVRAVLFDLDGTLVDTESQTDEAIARVAERHGVAGFALPANETRGRTWVHVAGRMRELAGVRASEEALAGQMLDVWRSGVQGAKPLPGAPAALRAAAAAGLKLAIVSSSPRSVIDGFVARLGADEWIDAAARIGADSVIRGKPDPEGFLLAARILGVDASSSLVFEDSQAGLLAARAAGMRAMFITRCATDIAANSALATARCTDYEHLPSHFWSDLSAGLIDLDAQSLP